MPQIALAFQPDMLGILSQFSQFDRTLDKYIAPATESSAGVIGQSGQDHMNFMNPTGQLHDSIEVIMQDAHHVFIGSPLSYAHRREFSFLGPDSLGRMFPNDPAGLFFTAALVDGETLQEVAQFYINAIYSAWNELVGSVPKGTSVSVGMVA